MKKDRNAFKAGLFILATIVLIVVIVVSIKGAGRFVEPQQKRVAVFPMGAGLSVRLGQIMLDLRAVYRRTASADMFSDLSSIGAWLRAGFEY